MSIQTQPQEGWPSFSDIWDYCESTSLFNGNNPTLQCQLFIETLVSYAQPTLSHQAVLFISEKTFTKWDTYIHRKLRHCKNSKKKTVMRGVCNTVYVDYIADLEFKENFDFTKRDVVQVAPRKRPLQGVEQTIKAVWSKRQVRTVIAIIVSIYLTILCGAHVIATANFQGLVKSSLDNFNSQSAAHCDASDATSCSGIGGGIILNGSH